MHLLLPTVRYKQLNNKTVWITGASSGIGSALAVALAKYGCKLILSARTPQALENVYVQCIQQGCKEVAIIPFDLCQPSTIEQAVLQFEKLNWPLHLLINNGGVGQRGNALQTENSVERNIMETNFWGQIQLTKLLIPQLQNTCESKIVVVSSMAGLMGIANRTSYCASKFALTGYFEAWRPELLQLNIKLLTIFPGRVNTPFSYNALTQNGNIHKQTDISTQNGLNAQWVANKIVNSICLNRKQIIIARNERILFFIKKWSMGLFYIIQKRV
jgi:dehydrogenase/reductase SDR family member 7B